MNNKSIYYGQVRVRACGFLEKNNSLLLLRHEGLGRSGFVWLPPGGGVDFGVSAEETLIREFREETGLEVEVGPFLFVNEYFDREYHAMEIFYRVYKRGGVERLGSDPEISPDSQILTDLDYLSYEKINEMDKSHLHNAFQFCKNAREIVELRGFFKFWNI